MKKLEYTVPYGKAIVNTDSQSFVFKDTQFILGPNIELIEIAEICIDADHRGQGYGHQLLKEIIDDYKDCAIVLKAEPMFNTFETFLNCSADEFILMRNRIINFYKNNGFCDINNFIGYEYGTAMMYNNMYYDILLERIK